MVRCDMPWWSLTNTWEKPTKITSRPASAIGLWHPLGPAADSYKGAPTRAPRKTHYELCIMNIMTLDHESYHIQLVCIYLYTDRFYMQQKSTGYIRHDRFFASQVPLAARRSRHPASEWWRRLEPDPWLLGLPWRLVFRVPKNNMCMWVYVYLHVCVCMCVCVGTADIL